jgi:hypothetical protein
MATASNCSPEVSCRTPAVLVRFKLNGGRTAAEARELCADYVVLATSLKPAQNLLRASHQGVDGVCQEFYPSVRYRTDVEHELARLRAMLFLTETLGYVRRPTLPID